MATQAKDPATIRAALQAYLAPQCETILALDPDLTVKTVHETRKAIRRIRSVLRTFDRAFQPEPATQLAEDAAWLATLLGEVRDADVLRARLTARTGAGDDRVITAELRTVRRKSSAVVTEALTSARYRHLRRQLAQWTAEPPFTEHADAPADAMEAYLDRARRLERKRVRRALEFGSSHETLHQARKAAKRHRYAGEVARPVLRRKARRRVKRSKAIQEILGRHQDSVVATDFLVGLPILQSTSDRLLTAERAALAQSRMKFRREMER